MTKTKGPARDLPVLTEQLRAAPVRYATRIIARGLVDLVEVKRDRLANGKRDALHDFRAALRRLRTWLRACRPWLADTVRGRTRRALAGWARATNQARDAEVAIAWLDVQGDSSGAAHVARRQLRARLRRVERAAARRFDAMLRREFPAVMKRLRRSLGHYRVDVPKDTPIETLSTARALAALVHVHEALLAESLRAVHSAADVVAAHRARIAGKRLRYLLEPLSTDPRVAAAVRRLTRLQDALGEFHDATVLARRIQQAGNGDVAIEELGVRAAARLSAAFAAVARTWLRDGGRRRPQRPLRPSARTPSSHVSRSLPAAWTLFHDNRGRGASPLPDSTHPFPR